MKTKDVFLILNYSTTSTNCNLIRRRKWEHISEFSWKNVQHHILHQNTVSPFAHKCQKCSFYPELFPLHLMSITAILHKIFHLKPLITSVGFKLNNTRKIPVFFYRVMDIFDLAKNISTKRLTLADNFSWM